MMRVELRLVAGDPLEDLEAWTSAYRQAFALLARPPADPPAAAEASGVKETDPRRNKP